MPNFLQMPGSVNLGSLITNDPTASITSGADPNSWLGDDPYLEMTEDIIFGAVNTLLTMIDDVTGLDLEGMIEPLEALLGGSGGLLSRLVAFLNPSSLLSGGGVFGPLLSGLGLGNLQDIMNFLNPTSLLSGGGVFGPLLSGLGLGNLQDITSFLNPSNLLAGGGVFGPLLSGLGLGNLQDITAFLNPTTFIGAAAGVLAPLFGGDGSFLLDFIPNIPASIIDGLDSAVTDIIDFLGLGGTDFGDLVEGLFGVSGGDQTTFNLLGGNLMSLLGDPNLNVASVLFDPIDTARTMLQNVLTPAGALTTLTQIPQHLFGWLTPGQTTTTGTTVIRNLLPDPHFSDPLMFSGLGIWGWDGSKDHSAAFASVTGTGSAKTIAAGTLRQNIGVPIKTTPGQVTDLGIWVWWQGAASSAGHGIVLAANSYNSADTIITDSARVVSAIDHPTGTSVGFSGTDPIDSSAMTADGAGWVYLSGTHQAPAGTSYVRLTFEVEATVSAGSFWFDDALHSLRGPIDASLIGNLSNIGSLLPDSVFGVQGITDLVNTFQHMLDGLGSAFHPTSTVSGLDFSDLFGLAQTQTQNAITALEQAITNTLQLGNRTNKPVSSGINATSEAMFSVGHFSSGGSVTTTSLAGNGNAISQMVRVAEDAHKGFVEFLASGTSVTNIFVNVYKVNPTTLARTALWNSSNIAASIPSSLGYVQALIAGGIDVKASDLLQIEIVNGTGSNPLIVATKVTGIPNHPTDIPVNFGCTRLATSPSPTSFANTSVVYSGTVPYINFGIADVPADYHPGEGHKYTAAGSVSGGLTLPSWLVAGDVVDVLGIGGGGGGGGSVFPQTGQGGGRAIWSAIQLVVGTDIKVGDNMTITIGAGGAFGGGVGGNGGNGGSTVITYHSPSNVLRTITAVGGNAGFAGSSTNPAGASPSGNGLGAASVTFDGTTYFGSADVGLGATGNAPGGGGGGGLPYLSGAVGGIGECDIVFEKTI